MARMRRRPGTWTARSGASELTRLYDEHADGLYRYALIVLADHGMAEDAVHQVFAKLLAAGGERPALEQPDRYLRRAVRNECYSLLGRRRVDPPADSAGRPLLGAAGSADRPDDPTDRLAIETALRQMPAEQREVVVLKVYEGWTFHEIADATGVPLNTVASRYRYALEKLRATLAPLEPQEHT
jgi:RNA polymerase sigma-70 factor (ECF subfamily)